MVVHELHVRLGVPAAGTFALTIAVMLLLAWLMNRYVEKPLTPACARRWPAGSESVHRTFSGPPVGPGVGEQACLMADSQQTPTLPGELKDVPGWFPPLDQVLFTWFLEKQQLAGDLLELGVYMGKSAILLGHHLRPGEAFTVCDLFGGEAPTARTARRPPSRTRPSPARPSSATTSPSTTPCRG